MQEALSNNVSTVQIIVHNEYFVFGWVYCIFKKKDHYFADVMHSESKWYYYFDVLRGIFEPVRDLSLQDDGKLSLLIIPESRNQTKQKSMYAYAY